LSTKFPEHKSLKANLEKPTVRKGGQPSAAPERSGRSCSLSGFLQRKRFAVELAATLVDSAAEVLIEGIEGVGLQFRECAAELLFNVVNRVEEGAPVDMELTADEFPVSTEEVMISKYFVIEFIQRTAAHQAEVGYVFFTLARVRPAALPAPAHL
jgi:hypothetical protein